MPSAPTPHTSLAEACCQWRLQPGAPRGLLTPLRRTLQPRGSGIRLPGSTERPSTALFIHIAVEAQAAAFQLDPVLVDWAGWEVRTPDMPAQPSPAQSHPHLVLVASSPELAQLWWGKQKLRGAQLREGHLRRGKNSRVGEPSPSQKCHRDLLPAHPLGGKQERSGQTAGPGPSPVNSPIN